MCIPRIPKEPWRTRLENFSFFCSGLSLSLLIWGLFLLLAKG